MTTQILNSTQRVVRGQSTLADPTGIVTKPVIVLPLLPANGAWSVKGRVTATSSTGISCSIEIDTAGAINAGTSTASAVAQVLTPAAAGVLANIVLALTGPGAAGQQLEYTILNGVAAEAVTVFWTWNLTVERTTTS